MNRAVRILLVVAAMGAALAAAFGVRALLQNDDDITEAKGDESSFSVTDAISRQPTKPVRVEGFVFQAEASGSRLCYGVADDEGPACIGPFLTLVNFDPGRVNLERESRDDGAVAYSRDPVILLGTVEGTAFTVQEIVS
jgi:hypothetical protein